MTIKKSVNKLLVLLVTMCIVTSTLISCGSKTNNESNQSDQTNQATKENPSQKDETKQATKEDLSQKELEYFTTYFSDANNNGFLLCNYDDPKQLDLNKVLHDGAGCDKNMPKISDAERSAYLKAVGQSEVNGDLHSITTKQINSLLQEKVGINLSQITKQLPWTYLKEYDTYYTEQSEAYYFKLNCTSGYKTSDNFYVIECSNAEAGNVRVVEKCQVKLKKVGDTYTFQSNKIEK